MKSIQSTVFAVQSRWVSAPAEKRQQIVFWLYSAFLYLAGALVWGYFWNWGAGPFTYHDWADVTIPRLTFLSNAVRAGVLPLHLADQTVLSGVTDRFQTIPDVLLSPQILLLRWMDLGTFILVNFWLLYTIGFAGILRFCQKRRLSALSLSILFLLFNFNGNLVAHFSVGHYTWTGCFLYPWLMLLVFDLLDGEGGWRWVTKTAALSLVMLLQGGYHQFVWMLFLIALLVLIRPRQMFTLVSALVFSILINAVRIAPLVLNLGKINNPFIGGFPFIQTIWYAMVDVQVPNVITNNLSLTGNMGAWEISTYTGIIGALFLLGFGLFSVIRNRQYRGIYAPLLIPTLGLVLLSLDQVFRNLQRVLPVPIFTGERVSSRIILLVMVILLYLAVLEFERWRSVQAQKTLLLAVSLAFEALVVNDLWQNIHLWKISAAAALFPQETIQPNSWPVANHADPTYLAVLAVGALISLAAIALLAFLWRKKFLNNW